MSPFRARRAAALVCLLVAGALAVPATSSAAPIAPLPTDPAVSRVIVTLDAPYRAAGLLTAAARSGQAERLAAVRARLLDRLAGTGHRTLRTYTDLPYVAVEASPVALARLRTSPEVIAIEPDQPHTATLAQSVPLVGAPAAWAAGSDGAGQIVAVLDTGVETTHPFLRGKVVAEACFASEGTCPNGTSRQIGAGAGASCTYDTSGCPHGTHVAGIVAGRYSGYDGVARGASIASIQVFTGSTECGGGPSPCAISWTSDLLAGLDHVATLAASRPVAAVNLSLGGGSYSGACDSQQSALKQAIDTLRTLGVATVVSSGNAGTPDAIASPACISSAIAVGSTSKTDVVSSFSNSSSQLALLAPGEEIKSAYVNGGAAWMSGTSQAAPHVAGAFAVLKQVRPTASVSAMLTALSTTGKPVTDARNGRRTPRLQVDAARVSLLAALPSTTSPTPTASPAPSPTASPAPSPTASPAPSPTASPAPSPTASPAPSPTASPAPSPTASPAPSPTASPAPSPTASPAPSPTASPAPSPTASPAPSPTASPAPDSVRLSGTDRYDTAASIFTAGFGCAGGGATSAVLARGDAFADALSGSYLAGSRSTGVLLTETGSVPARTLDALRGSGARTVYLLGGTAAISDAVAAQLAATPSYDCTGVRGAALQVERLFGTDRFDTARRIAEYAGSGAVGTADAPGTSRPLRTAVVASGMGFADALAAGPLSYAGAATTTYGSGRGFPTLLTGSAALSPEVESSLRDLGIEQVLLPGGTGVVSPAVQSRLEALGLNVIRLAGNNRSETAVAVARFAVESLGFPRSGVALARGDAFADALAGAAYAGKRTTPLLLTAGPTTLGDATRDYLSAGGDLTNSLTVFGGEGAVSTGTFSDALRSLLG